MSVLAATLVADRKSMSKLAQFVGEDLPYDGGAWNYHREDNLAYMSLAKLLVSGSLDRNDPILVEVTSSRRKRAKLIVQGAMALARNSPADLMETVATLTKEFSRKSDLEGLMISCWDASILFNVAVMKGLDVCAPGPPLGDFLTTKETVFS